MSKLSLNKSLRADKKIYREKVLERLCCEISYNAKSSKNGKVPYGLVNKLVKQMEDQEPWVTRNVLNFAYRKFSKNTKVSEQAPSIKASSRTAGRPKGSTKLKKHHLKEVVLAAKNEIATIYLIEKEKYKQKGMKLPNGWLNSKIAEITNKRGVPNDISISPSTIRKRKQGQMVTQGGGPRSLMAPIEPYLIDLIISMAEFRRCLSMSEALALGNDLIRMERRQRQTLSSGKKKGMSIEKMHLCWEQSGGVYSKKDGLIN